MASNGPNRFGEHGMMNDSFPAYLTKKAALIMGAVVGFAFALVIAAVATGGYFLAKEIQSRSRTDHQIEKIVKKFNPTPHQIEDSILDALNACQSSRRCRLKLARTVKRAKKLQNNRDDNQPSRRGDSKGASTTGTPDSTGSVVGSPEKPGNNPVVSRPNAPSKPGATVTPPSQPATSSNPAPNPTPQPEPTPVVNIQVPPLPALCVGAVIGINCK